MILREAQPSFYKLGIRWGFYFLVFVLGWFSASCIAQENLEQEEANSQIFSAASYKARECGNPIPDPYLYVISKEVPQRNIDLCTFAILRTTCPLNSFPAVCILIYLDELGDIPQPLNFNDFVNDKL